MKGGGWQGTGVRLIGLLSANWSGHRRRSVRQEISSTCFLADGTFILPFILAQPVHITYILTVLTYIIHLKV